MKSIKNWPAGRKIAFALYLAIALIFFYSYYYADFYETGLEGVRFWDILFAGKIHNFYTQIFRIGNTQYVPLYDFPMYIIFAIWNFPLWIVEKVSGIDIYHSVPCLMWMKSMLLAWTILFLWEFGKLISELFLNNEAEDPEEAAGSAVPDQGNGAMRLACVEGSASFSKEKIREGRFLFLTSMFFMTGLIVLGQYDIICMTFMMKGLQAYIRGNDKRFILWFAFSAPLKYFSLLIYVPLILVKEKRISRILLRGIEVAVPMLFFWIAVPYGRPGLVEGCTFSGSSEGTNIAKPIFDALFIRGSVGFGTLFVYIFAEVLFLVLCYVYKVREEDDRNRLTVYLCFAAYMIQFTFGYSHPYWLILLVPFMILIILQNEKYHYINLLLETVLTVAMAAAQIFYYTWCFNAGIVQLSFWKDLLPAGIPKAGEPEYSVITVLSQFITDQRLQDYASGIFLSIYAACMLVFAVINFPLWRKSLPITGREKNSYRWLYVLRGLLTVLCGSVPLLLYIDHAFG